LCIKQIKSENGVRGNGQLGKKKVLTYHTNCGVVPLVLAHFGGGERNLNKPNKHEKG